VWYEEDGPAKAVDEDSQRLILFLSDVEEREGCGLIWAIAGEVSSEHMGEGVEVVDGVCG